MLRWEVTIMCKHDQLYDWLLDIISENEEDLGLIHPVLPDQVDATLSDIVE